MEDKEQRTKLVTIRVTETEKATWEKEATKRHMNLAEFIRHLFAKFTGI